ncbi:MAG: HAD family hydrolase [Fidelibacterota bacterium]
MEPIRIAMWSGPRNISTVMMRSFSSRSDTIVTDEPFYSFYLLETGLNHPGREEIIQSQPTDWDEIVAWLTGPLPGGKTIWYQKHMAHHILPGHDLSWIKKMVNCFLIRNPKDVIVSYIRVNKLEKADELGFPQQKWLYDELRNSADCPIVIVDSDEILTNPRKALSALCQSIGIDFDERMLTWPRGIQPTDGVWAKYWYGNLKESTTFLPRRAEQKTLPDKYQDLYLECLPYYQELYARRLEF